jgi:FdhD protein
VLREAGIERPVTPQNCIDLTVSLGKSSNGLQGPAKGTEKKATMSQAVFETSVESVRERHSLTASDRLATEEPLEIQLCYGPATRRATKSISVTMRTPGDDLELAAGFLMTEGVLKDPADIQSLEFGPHGERRPLRLAGRQEGVLPLSPGGNRVVVQLSPGVEVSLATLERNFYTTSSCGVCGKASLLALQTVCPPRLPNTFSIEADVLYHLPRRLREEQNIFDRTGGLHAAGLFDAAGSLLGIREDVGRHNAVDKLIGAEFLADRTPLRNKLLLLSGRASFELLQKALMGGVSMVASVGAPSSLAVQVARQFDIELVGFLRQDHFNVYHGAEHIRGLERVDGEALGHVREIG